MKNHLNILPKLASFDLKCSKMRWRLGLRPRPRWGSLRRSPRPPNRKRQHAFGARHSLFRVHFYISIPLSGPPLRNSWIRHWLQATASEGFAKGPNVAARAELEPTTLRSKGIDSTNAPLRPTHLYKA